MVFHSDELRKEARQLKKELLAIKQRKDEGLKKEEKQSEGECRHHMITTADNDTECIIYFIFKSFHAIWRFEKYIFVVALYIKVQFVTLSNYIKQYFLI